MSSTVGQLNALFKLQRYLNISAKKVLINTYAVSDFNYYPLAWMFPNVKSLDKIEGLHIRALRFPRDKIYVFI